MKKIALIMLAVVSMALVSCGGGGVMTPQTTKVSGDLKEYFEVVDAPVKLQGDIWAIQLKCIKEMPSEKDSWYGKVLYLPYGVKRNSYRNVGFGLETYAKDGSLINKRSATEGGIGGPYSHEDVQDIINLKVGDIGIIQWSCKDSEKKVKGMTFKITSALSDKQYLR